MGDGVHFTRAPGSWIAEIQHVYNNSFNSIWEYKEALLAKKINWQLVLGQVCPVCGKKCRFRQITEYHRNVIELYPFRAEMVPVARFLCKINKTTFSLLPYQLAPYFQYTVSSLVFAILLWHSFSAEAEEEEKNSSSAYAVTKELPQEHSITSWMLHCWLAMLKQALCAAQSHFHGRYDFSRVKFGLTIEGSLNEVHGYCAAFSRGPPNRNSLKEACKQYNRDTGRFLLGTPSQERRAAR